MPGRARRAAGVEWGFAASTLRGETESGDMHVVQEVPWGCVLAVVDGIGHGPPAREASQRAVDVVARSASRGTVAVIKQCHAALIGTRGAVMSIAAVDQRDDTVTWLGVGNVAGLLVRADPRATPAREVMLARGGVVGVHLPLLQASVVSIAPGDVLVIATDGVRPEFQGLLSGRMPPAALANRVLSEHGRETDDALVLAARYAARPAADAPATVAEAGGP